ncbi:hypothetical protein [Desulfurobacterium sp. TC5-1]|uniref:hypothetical protein n=1 Tax=Desulfurobacterium sp. TC5-1 TaxID=1158318 RepID=UPI0003B3C9DA|nr:hypothetical protein [Desulfurobacterium sp. TC5-1]
MKVLLWKDGKVFGKFLIESRWDVRLSSSIQEILERLIDAREQGSNVYATCGCKLPGGEPLKLYLKRNKRFINLVSFPGHGRFHSSFCLFKKQDEEFIVETDEGLDVSASVFLSKRKRASRTFDELMIRILGETEILAFNYQNSGISRFSKRLKNVNAREAIPIFVRLIRKEIKVRGISFTDFLEKHKLNMSCGIIYEWRELDRAVKVCGLVMYPDEKKAKYREIYLPKMFIYKAREMFPPLFFVSFFVPEKSKLLRLFLYRIERFVPVRTEAQRQTVKTFIKSAVVFVPLNRGFDRILTKEVTRKIDVNSLETPDLVIFDGKVTFLIGDNKIVVENR